MRIIKLQSENVKKVKAIEISPKEDVVIISGNNGQGKTSVLDSIWFALQGRAGLKDTPMPIRKGEKKASVTLTLDDFIVTRTWTADDKSYLKVTNREGLTYNSPQELLDGFIGALTFDPLEFAQMKEKDQRDLLLKLANVDIDSYNEKIKTLTEYRRLQGQTVKLYEGERDTRDFSGVPTEEISIIELQSRLEEAIDHNRDMDGVKDKIGYSQEEIRKGEIQIIELENKIKSLKTGILTYKNMIDSDQKFIRDNEKIDIEAMRATLNKALEINELVQAKNRNVLMDKKRDSAQEVYDDYTDKIDMQKKGKDTALRLAKMPIEGLSVNETGVIYNEIPFSQLSSSEQLIVSLCIAMALNPKLRVIRITDGSLLDEMSMNIIKKYAKAEKYQVWCEKVSGTGEVGFYIEEGEIVAIDGKKIGEGEVK